MKPVLHKVFTIETYNGHRCEVTVSKVNFPSWDDRHNYGLPEVEFEIVEVIPFGSLAEEIRDAVRDYLIDEHNEEKPF